MLTEEKNFEISYKWSSSIIPFHEYFIHKNLKLFWISNIAHNFDWLNKYKEKINETHLFLVNIGTYYHQWLVEQDCKMLSHLGIDKSHFIIMANDERERLLFDNAGFRVEIINNNCWIDYNIIKPVIKQEKIFDAIYVSRLLDWKRHFLTNKLQNLALIAGNAFGDENSSIDLSSLRYDFINIRQISSNEICYFNSISQVGLILSESEGACFASSEYLLCGIPVVSTHSEGGRHVYYDEYNSIICEPSPDAVVEAVKFFINNKPDADIIRDGHIKKQEFYRNKFLILFNNLLSERGVTDVDANYYFLTKLIHKGRYYCAPDFDMIFS